MSKFNDFLNLILKPRPQGNCVICGHLTTNTAAGEFVCDYGDPNSLACKVVWNDRITRRGLPTRFNAREVGYDGLDELSYWNERDEYRNYKSYIRSYEWETKATHAKRRAGWRCQRCGRNGDSRTLHAHHKSYERLYHERTSDIEVLCEDCHRRHHGR